MTSRPAYGTQFLVRFQEQFDIHGECGFLPARSLGHIRVTLVDAYCRPPLVADARSERCRKAAIQSISLTRCRRPGLAQSPRKRSNRANSDHRCSVDLESPRKCFEVELIDALERHGIGRHDIFCDKVSGAKSDRPGLNQCLSTLRRGDTLVVWRLDRLGRSMRHLVTLIEDLRERGIGFRSLSDGMIDTTTASGELIFNVFAALAQFERRLIAERTKAGLAAARARGRKGRRPPMLPSDPRVVLARKLFQDKSIEVGDICSTLRISRATLYRWARMGEASRQAAPHTVGHN